MSINLLTTQISASYDYIELNNTLISCSQINNTTYCPAISVFKELGYDSYYSYNKRLFIISKSDQELYTIDPYTSTITNLVTTSKYKLHNKVFISEYSVYIPVEEIIHDFAQSDIVYISSSELSTTKRR